MPRSRGGGCALLRRALLGIVALVTMVAGGAWVMHAGVEFDRSIASDPESAERKLSLAEVKSWGYQLQNLDPAAVAKSTLDLIVVDPTSLDISRAKLRDAAFEKLRLKPDGSRRLVLAYLSIGEAEDYRGYWRPEWVEPAPIDAEHSLAKPTGQHRGPGPGVRPARAPSRVAPSWLAGENPEWRGNYRVRFWESGWQSLLIGASDAAVPQLVAAGFDGIYIDRADAHTAFRSERPAAEGEMVDLIVRIAKAARDADPGFMVVMQNAEELLAHARLRSAIDAVAKEDLLFGLSGSGTENEASEIRSSLHFLDKVRRQGRPVFVVEYLDDPVLAGVARRKLSEMGFIPYFAPRDLGRLNLDF